MKCIRIATVQWFPFRLKLLQQICPSATKSCFRAFGASLKSFPVTCAAPAATSTARRRLTWRRLRLKGQLEWQPMVNSCGQYNCSWCGVFLTPKALCCNLLRSPCICWPYRVLCVPTTFPFRMAFNGMLWISNIHPSISWIVQWDLL